jgi:hypothetical protein
MGGTGTLIVKLRVANPLLGSVEPPQVTSHMEMIDVVTGGGWMTVDVIMPADVVITAPLMLTVVDQFSENVIV